MTDQIPLFYVAVFMILSFGIGWLAGSTHEIKRHIRWFEEC